MDNKEKVLDIINDLRKKTEDIFKGIQLPNFYINYNLTSLDTLGAVKHDLNEMRLNEYLLNENFSLYISEIVEHEFAHFVVRALYPKQYNKERKKNITSHGFEFKEVCKKLKIKGHHASTSAFDNSPYLNSLTKKSTRWSYACSCDTEHFISTRKHNLIQNGKDYLCVNCETSIFYIQNV